MRVTRSLPVHNRGAQTLDVGIEPEGDCVVLEPGETLEFRYELDQGGDPQLEIVFDGQLLSVYCMAPKEIWRGGKQLR